MPGSFSFGRFNRALEKLINIKGGPTLFDVSPSLYPIYAYATGAENRYLEGWNLYHAAIGVAAVAAQFSRVLLRNPAGSGALVVVEWWLVSSLIDWAMTNNQPDLTNLVTGTLNRLDSRSGFSAPSSHFSWDTNATQFPGAAAVIIKQVSANPAGFVQEIPILPGDGLWFASDVVNTAVQVNIRFRERSLESSELT